MPKSSTPVLENDVIKDSSIDSSIIYISIILCILVVGAYFMYKVYKKLQTMNQDIIDITERGDTLDSSGKETSRQIDSLGENFNRYYKEFKNTLAKQESKNGHEEILVQEHKLGVENSKVEQADTVKVSTPVVDLNDINN